MEVHATINTNKPTTILLITPGKIGLTLSINKTEGGATVTKVEPNSRFKDKFQEGDRIVTIDGCRITKIADLHVNRDKVRRFGVVQKKPGSTTNVVSDNQPPFGAAAAPDRAQQQNLHRFFHPLLQRFIQHLNQSEPPLCRQLLKRSV